MENKLLNYCLTKFDNWGKGANFIQDLAETTLSEEEFNEFLKKSSEEVALTEGQDGIMFNGEYFDWREFDFKAKEILTAFLKYFTKEQISEMEWML